MNKPISIILEELQSSLAKTIVDTGLSMYLVEPIVKDLYVNVVTVAEQQKQAERKQYEEALAKEAAEQEEKENSETEEIENIN